MSVPDEQLTATATPDVLGALDGYRRRVDRALETSCRDLLAPVDDVAPRVGEAIRYGVLGGGKRLRGMLFLSCFDAAAGSGDGAPLAAAIEIVHAYSLVHDDLPCMDDDDMRRGRPTVHRVYGVRTATIAGVAMVPFAARVAVHASRELGLPLATSGRIVAALMAASGASGMIGGQVLDLEGEGREHRLVDLERIHRAKTGALIAAAARLGGIAAGADETMVDAFDRYGAALGLAFQIADDVLDVTATTDALGKTAGRDLALRKSTYPSLLGVDGARERARALVHDASDALAAAGVHSPVLDHIAHFVIARSS